ncbi:MAG: hypothetical protein KC636_20395 [Myxococcales bacterium]|nr:hypothetical protein [Myxococcales bacterium]
MTMRRRALLTGLAAATLAPQALAAPPQRSRKLENRLELWRAFAHKTRTLRAHYTCTRTSSLLRSPLVVTGVLAFTAPQTLVLRDDIETGAITRVEGDAVSVTPVAEETPRGPTLPETPAARWLAARLVHLFAPGDGEALLAGCVVDIPRGGMQLALHPPRGSSLRRVIRRLLVQLDPITGAVHRVELEEARGDRVVLELGDHRQNLG